MISLPRIIWIMAVGFFEAGNLSCPGCKKDGAFVIVGAETPGALLRHSLASPTTVAYVMYQEYVNSVPLYRQAFGRFHPPARRLSVDIYHIILCPQCGQYSKSSQVENPQFAQRRCIRPPPQVPPPNTRVRSLSRISAFSPLAIRRPTSGFSSKSPLQQVIRT